MKICSPQLGLYANSRLGGGVHDYEILKGLARLGVKIDIPLMMTLKCEKEKNWNIYKIPVRRLFKLGFLLTNTVFFLWVAYIWIKEGFDILRIPYPEHVGYMSYIMKKLFKVKTIATYHHLEPEGILKKYFNKKIAHSFSHIITDSEFSKREIFNQYELPSDSISVVYNGISDRYTSLNQKQTPSNNKLRKNKIFLSVGSLIPRKNYFFLVDVFKEITSHHPDVILIICGSGYPNDNYDKQLKEHIRNYNLEEQVILTGEVSEEQKISYYLLCDVYVHPSLLEGFGLSVAEAMACGKPVVASHVGSLPELIEDGVTGFLIPPKDIRAFEEKLELLLEHEEIIETMGAKGREKIELFTWHEAAQKTLDVYKRVYENNICLS